MGAIRVDTHMQSRSEGWQLAGSATGVPPLPCPRISREMSSGRIAYPLSKGSPEVQIKSLPEFVTWIEGRRKFAQNTPLDIATLLERQRWKTCEQEKPWNLSQKFWRFSLLALRRGVHRPGCWFKARLEPRVRNFLLLNGSLVWPSFPINIISFVQLYLLWQSIPLRGRKWHC